MSENLKLTLVSEYYDVNTENSNYVAITECTLLFRIKSKRLTDILKRMSKKTLKKLPIMLTSGEITPMFYIKAIGKSYCDKSDDFDVNFGKKRAYSRAFIKAYNSYYKILSFIESQYINSIREFTHNKERCTKLIYDEYNRLSKSLIKYPMK